MTITKSLLVEAMDKMNNLIIIKSGYPTLISEEEVKKTNDVEDLFLSGMKSVVVKLDTDKYEKLRFISLSERTVTINRESIYVPHNKVATFTLWEFPTEDVLNNIKDEFSLEENSYYLYEFKVIDIPYHLTNKNMDIEYPCVEFKVSSSPYSTTTNMYYSSVLVYPDARFIEPISASVEYDLDLLACNSKSILNYKKLLEAGVFNALKGKHLLINDKDLLKMLFVDNKTNIIYAYSVFEDNYETLSFDTLYDILTNDNITTKEYPEDFKFLNEDKFKEEISRKNEEKVEDIMKDIKSIVSAMNYIPFNSGEENNDPSVFDLLLVDNLTREEIDKRELSESSLQKIRSVLESVMGSGTIEDTFNFLYDENCTYALYEKDENNNIQDIIIFDDFILCNFEELYNILKEE